MLSRDALARDMQAGCARRKWLNGGCVFLETPVTLELGSRLGVEWAAPHHCLAGAQVRARAARAALPAVLVSAAVRPASRLRGDRGLLSCRAAVEAEPGVVGAPGKLRSRGRRRE